MKFPNKTFRATLNYTCDVTDNQYRMIPFDVIIKFVCDFSSKIEDKFGIVPDNNEITIDASGYSVLLSWSRDLENPDYDKEMEEYQIRHKAEKIRELKRQQKLQSLESKREVVVENRKQRILKNIEDIVTKNPPNERLETLNKYLSDISKDNVFSDTVKEKVM